MSDRYVDQSSNFDWEVDQTVRAEKAETECERLRAALDEAMPLIAALAVYGENANLSALAAKARELNEAHRAALGQADE